MPDGGPVRVGAGETNARPRHEQVPGEGHRGSAGAKAADLSFGIRPDPVRDAPGRDGVARRAMQAGCGTPDGVDLLAGQGERVEAGEERPAGPPRRPHDDPSSGRQAGIARWASDEPVVTPTNTTSAITRTYPGSESLPRTSLTWAGFADTVGP